MVHFIVNGIIKGRECVGTTGDPRVDVSETTRVHADFVQKIANSRAFIAIDDVTSVSEFRVCWIENVQ